MCFCHLSGRQFSAYLYFKLHRHCGELHLGTFFVMCNVECKEKRPYKNFTALSDILRSHSAYDNKPFESYMINTAFMLLISWRSKYENESNKDLFILEATHKETPVLKFTLRMIYFKHLRLE